MVRHEFPIQDPQTYTADSYTAGLRDTLLYAMNAYEGALSGDGEPAYTAVDDAIARLTELGVESPAADASEVAPSTPDRETPASQIRVIGFAALRSMQAYMDEVGVVGSDSGATAVRDPLPPHNDKFYGVPLINSVRAQLGVDRMLPERVGDFPPEDGVS